VLAFVTDTQGNVIAKAPNVAQPAAFAKWLDEQAASYERTHPATRVPLILANVTAAGEGDDRKATCSELDAARDEKRLVLLYVGRSERSSDDKKAKSVASASRKFEKATLGSKKAAEAAEGLVLLRLDVGNRDHALLAESPGVEKVPTLLLWAPKAEKPDDLGGRLSGASLASKLKKAIAAAAQSADE